MDQIKLAKAIGVSDSVYSRWEKGKVFISGFYFTPFFPVTGAMQFPA